VARDAPRKGTNFGHTPPGRLRLRPSTYLSRSSVTLFTVHQDRQQEQQVPRLPRLLCDSVSTIHPVSGGFRASTRCLEGTGPDQQRVATTTRAWAGYEEDSRFRDSFVVFSFLFAQHHSLSVEPLTRERRVFESISTHFFPVNHQHHDL
jgi:hypothetical protein